MKKLFVAVLAIAAVVACNKEQTVATIGPAAIAFEGASVDKATRANEAVDPSTTTNTIDAFNVWGFMDEPAGKVFEKEEVTKNGGVWGYANTQYWTVGHNYYFAALAPMNSANWNLNTEAANEHGAGIVDFINVEGTEDLIYAAATVDATEAVPAEAVGLTFNHLLSKVKFTFTNGFSNELATIDVKNVRMVVPGTGSINLAQADWWSTNQWNLADGVTTTLAFGDACSKTAIGVSQVAANERLTIPADATQSYQVLFDVVYYQGDVVAYEKTDYTTTIEGVALEIGKAYNFTAELNASNIAENPLLPIEFTVVEVKEWVNAETPDAQVEEAELRYAAQVGGVVTLNKDYELTTPLVVNGNLVLNLNGHSIVNTTKTAEYGMGEGIVVYGELTINGEGTVSGCTRAVWARGAQGAKVTINGGTYYGAEDGYAEGGCSVIYASSGNTIDIYGGTFKALAADVTSYADKTGVYAALNVADNNGMISVYGGEFYKQNPAAPGTEPKAWNEAHPNGFVAEGYFSTLVGDNYIVADAQMVATADDFAAAMKSDAEDIKVALAADLDVAITSLGQQTGGSGEYKLGGENTKTITIDLNGKKLNITTTYWSAIGAKNADALFTIKNGTMTSTGNSAGTWNAWDIRLSNCNYAIEDVVFEKAVALDNVGKSTTMKNVTITDTHNTDTYGLWITAEGQTVTLDGCVIDMTPASDGRGIKIDEQYVDAPAKVTLNVSNTTFKTDEKAAILVKSVEGAEINVENIDITGVAADAVNAVWVDSDAAAYAAKVVVNGANCIVEN